MAQCSRGRYPMTGPHACNRPTGQGSLQQPRGTGWLMEQPPSPTFPVTITERQEASSRRASQWPQHPGAGSDTLYLTGQTQSGSTVLPSTLNGGNLTTWWPSHMHTHLSIYPRVHRLFCFSCFFLNKFIYLFLAVFWVIVSVRGLPLVAASGGHSSSRCAGLSLSWPLLLRSTGSRRAGSVIVAHGPSCSAACGIFPDQGSNPYPLHWQADSQPLRHHGSPAQTLFVMDLLPMPIFTLLLYSLRIVALLTRNILWNLIGNKK